MTFPISTPGRIVIELLDITRRKQIGALRERLAGQRFDVLFVNAGVANRDPSATMSDITADEFTEVMLTNALGAMHAIEDLQDLVRPGGLIGAMSSGQGSIANNTNGRNDLYRSSKAALNQLMKSYAGRHAGEQRALVLMAPGWIRTDLGGPTAPFGMEEAIPQVVDALLAERGCPGLRFVDRFGKPVPLVSGLRDPITVAKTDSPILTAPVHGACATGPSDEERGTCR